MFAPMIPAELVELKTLRPEIGVDVRKERLPLIELHELDFGLDHLRRVCKKAFTTA